MVWSKGSSAVLELQNCRKNSQAWNHREFCMIWYSQKSHGAFHRKKPLAAFALVKRERNSSFHRFYYKGGSPNGSSDNFP